MNVYLHYILDEEKIKEYTSYIINKGLTSFPMMILNGNIYDDTDPSHIMNYVGYFYYNIQGLVYNGIIDNKANMYIHYYVGWNIIVNNQMLIKNINHNLQRRKKYIYFYFRIVIMFYYYLILQI